MKKPFLRNSLLALIVSCALCLCGSAVSSRGQTAIRTSLPAGSYTGAQQVMTIAADGKPRYGDNLGICHIEIKADGSLEAYFPNLVSKKEGVYHRTVQLPFSTNQPRDTWTTRLQEDTYKVMAIPFSGESYVFRLEILRGDKLVGGAQQFYGICNSITPRNSPTPRK